MKPRLILLLILMVAVIAAVWWAAVSDAPLAWMARGFLFGSAAILAWWLIEDVTQVEKTSRDVEIVTVDDSSDIAPGMNLETHDGEILRVVKVGGRS